MKAIENEGLQAISKIIVESISTSSIYCFGEKKNIQTVQNPFQEFISCALLQQARCTLCAEQTFHRRFYHAGTCS